MLFELKMMEQSTLINHTNNTTASTAQENIVTSNHFTPWMEKYRPLHFDGIVLDPLNRRILKNIIDTSYFPNLLFYGPPGTGKTTTIMNLIKAYQEKLGFHSKEMIIHLNASDERGIDIIRNQIHQFVNSKNLFHKGLKFVILDEIDYMTKNAQQALGYLLQSSNSNNVRFCLICNYISRIDEKLQNEFIKLQFNQLPKEEIVHFLKKISHGENLQLDDSIIMNIQQMYKSDIRSMINFIQVNLMFLSENHMNPSSGEGQTPPSKTKTSVAGGKAKSNVTKPSKKTKTSKNNVGVVTSVIMDEQMYHDLSQHIKTDPLKQTQKYIHQLSIQYNMDKKNIIKDYLNFLIRNYPKINCTEFLNCIEHLVHNQKCTDVYYVNYAITMLSKFLNKLDA